MGGEATVGQDLLMKDGVVGCLVNGEHMVCSLVISSHEEGGGVGLVSQRPAFPVGHMLEGAQECLNVIIPSEFAKEELGVPFWIGERSRQCWCQLAECWELLSGSMEAQNHLLVELALL